MKRFLLLLPIILCVGCGKKEVELSQLELRQGIIYLRNSEKPFTGSAFAFYKNGQKMQERTFDDGKSAGVHMWHVNGQKGAVLIFKESEVLSERYWNNTGDPVDSLEESALLD
jgi:hypothetical protein